MSLFHGDYSYFFWNKYHREGPPDVSKYSLALNKQKNALYEYNRNKANYALEQFGVKLVHWQKELLDWDIWMAYYNYFLEKFLCP